MAATDRSDPYAIREELPDPETFAALREAAGMPPRSLEGIERGLSNSLYGVVAVHEPTGEVVGMGRIVGDDGAVYQISDMAVRPEHQGRGIGTRIMERLEAYIEETRPPRRGRIAGRSSLNPGTPSQLFRRSTDLRRL